MGRCKDISLYTRAVYNARALFDYIRLASKKFYGGFGIEREYYPVALRENAVRQLLVYSADKLRLQHYALVYIKAENLAARVVLERLSH